MFVPCERASRAAKCPRGSASFRGSVRAMFFVLFFVLFFVAAEAYIVYEPLFNTRFGEMRGKFSISARGRPVANFVGIPYAEPPIGHLRFKSPQPWNRTWDTVYDATQDGPMCVQRDSNGAIVGEEDCLYLNIFIPIISGRRDAVFKLPVMVYVHGGAYNGGSSNSRHLAPDYLMDQDVILVTLNYRLNVFGFFSTGDRVSPGNYGLKDIKLALEWVHENIEPFFGDPDEVTLFGQSAGAGAVHLLALTEKTEGLFNRYILHSGSALAPWAVHSTRAIRRSSIELAKLLGCLTDRKVVDDVTETTTERTQAETTERIAETSRDENETSFHERRRYVDDVELSMEDEEAMMTCLRSVNATSIVQLNDYYHVWRMNPYCTFGPTLEEEAEDAVLTTHPLTVIKKHAFRDIPWIVGVVEDEGLLKSLGFYTDLHAEDEMTEYFQLYLPYLLEYQELISNTTAFAKAIEDFYYNGNVTGRLIRNITEVIGDALFTWPTYQALKYQSEVMNSSTYFFLFSYEGTFSYTFSSGISIHYGVSHGDDINYLFPILNNLHSNQLLQNTENDTVMINVMTEMWASFATEGVPRTWSVPEWPDYRVAGEFLRFGSGGSTEVVVETELFPDRMAFWEELTANITSYAEEHEAIEEQTAEGEDGKKSGSSVLIYESSALISLLILLVFYVL